MHSGHENDGRTAKFAGVADYDPSRVAAAMRFLSRQGSDHPPVLEALARLTQVAVDRVPGARWASITMLRGEVFTTAASSARQAVRADVLQYEMQSGPCVDAVLLDSLNLSGQVSTDSRWSEWGKRAHSEVGVNSVISQCLQPHSPSGAISGLNIYSDARDAFDQSAVGVAEILATHGALVLSETTASERAETLTRGLHSNRDIGVALGILMHQRRITRQAAFDMLRVASQNSNRKLADIALEVVDTGTLTLNDVA